MTNTTNLFFKLHITKDYLGGTPQDTPQDSTQDSTQDSVQDTTQDKNREVAILNYCKTPRIRDEIQKYIGINSGSYFREYILKPLLDSGKLSMTIPDKPNSKFQKYVSK